MKEKMISQKFHNYKFSHQMSIKLQIMTKTFNVCFLCYVNFCTRPTRNSVSGSIGNHNGSHENTVLSMV